MCNPIDPSLLRPHCPSLPSSRWSYAYRFNGFCHNSSMRHLVRALPRTACVRPGSSPLLSSASPSSLPRPPQSTRHLATTVDLTFGQPLHETHPHLLKAGERTVAPRAFLFALPFPSSLTAAPPSVTRGITAFEYAQRRANLARSLPDNSVAILAASDIKWRTGATFYKFHQDPSFFYLTGMI